MRPYGSGADPIIDGGGTADDCLVLDSPSGGIRLQDLEIRNCDRTGIYLKTGTETYGTAPDIEGDDFVPPGHGLLIERVNVHDIKVNPRPSYPLAAAYALMGTRYPALHAATGIYTYGASYIRIVDSEFSGNDIPFFVKYGRHWILDNVTATSSDWGHPYLVQANWPTYRNSTLRNIGWRGYPMGNAGLFTIVTRDMTIRNVTIQDIRRPISEIVTGTKTGSPTLTFAAAGNTITRSAGSWSTDSTSAGVGFTTAAPCYVTVTGASNGANNVVDRLLTGVTSTVLTLDGAALVDEATSAPAVTARCRIPDGVAVDQEADGKRTLYVGNTFGGAGADDIDGAALLLLDNAGVPSPTHEYTVIVNNTWTRWGAFSTPAMILHTRDTVNDPGHGLLIGNTLTRRSPAAGDSDRFCQGTGNGIGVCWPPNTTGSAPPNWYYANSNSPSTP